MIKKVMVFFRFLLPTLVSLIPSLLSKGGNINKNNFF